MAIIKSRLVAQLDGAENVGDHATEDCKIVTLLNFAVDILLLLARSRKSQMKLQLQVL